MFSSMQADETNTPPKELPEHNPVPETSQTHPGGRPAVPWETFQLDVDMVMVERMVKACLTEWQIAAVLGVHRDTLYDWKRRYPEFLRLLKNRPMEDGVVIRSLFERATGYNYESEKVMSYEGEIIRAAIIEHVPPDPTAIAIWLNNRQPGKWGRGLGRNTEININQMINVHVTSECVLHELNE